MSRDEKGPDEATFSRGRHCLLDAVDSEREPLPRESASPVRESLFNERGDHAGYRALPAPPCP
jgi:hypothetical protein